MSGAELDPALDFTLRAARTLRRGEPVDGVGQEPNGRISMRSHGLISPQPSGETVERHKGRVRCA